MLMISAVWGAGGKLALLLQDVAGETGTDVGSSAPAPSVFAKGQGKAE